MNHSLETLIFIDYTGGLFKSRHQNVGWIWDKLTLFMKISSTNVIHRILMESGNGIESDFNSENIRNFAFPNGA